MSKLIIRFAVESDAQLILDLIKELAVYEGLGDQVIATAEDIRVSLFEKNQAEALIAELGKQPAAFALFYPNYSAFSGRANLFLEDLFVREPYRGKGVGTALLQRLAQLSAERGGKRLDWLVLDENAAGAEFYKKYGAVSLDDRRVFGLSGAKLQAFAAQILPGGNEE